MKRILICGFLGINSSIWIIGLIMCVYNNLLSGWSGSRFWESAFALGITLPLVCSLIIMIASLVGLGIEYFRKGQKN